MSQGNSKLLSQWEELRVLIESLNLLKMMLLNYFIILALYLLLY